MMGEVRMGKEPTGGRSNGVFGFPVTPSRSSTPSASCLAGLSRQSLQRRRKPSRLRNRPIRSPAKRGFRGFHGCVALIGEIPAIRPSHSALPPFPTLASQTQSSRIKPGQTGSNPVKPSSNLCLGGWDSTAIAIYYGFPGEKHYTWWLPPLWMTRNSGNSQLPESCGVKPSQTQSKCFSTLTMIT